MFVSVSGLNFSQRSLACVDGSGLDSILVKSHPKVFFERASLPPTDSENRRRSHGLQLNVLDVETLHRRLLRTGSYKMTSKSNPFPQDMQMSLAQI